MAAKLKYENHHYGTEKDLQNLGIWEVDPADKSKVWVIYIHGGAWRDPRITHTSFIATIDNVMNSSDPDAPSRIAGFASLDYRLSAHEKLPQDSASTAPKEYRDARHPDHIDDVRAGVSFLQVKYGFADNYIIIGHSAGACLAFQLVAAPVKADVSVVPPAAVIGIAGIYDFIGLDERFKGTYTAFFESAFGDTKNWDTAAPVKASLGSWDGKVILAWSKEDSLVDEPEIDIMERKLRDDGFSPDVFKDLQGHHNDCWEKGTDIARLIKFGICK